MATRSDELSAARRRRRARAAEGNLSEIQTVVLAGGRGTRLAPYTSVLPKPLMPIGEQSILELVVEQLAEAGIEDIHFCVGYLAHLVEAVFENRENGHVKITYVREQEALGTAAPLRLVEGLDNTFIVMNGDVLTTLDYRDLVSYHRAQNNLLTIATHKRSIKIDYGMLHLDVTSRVRAFEEKPEIVSPVSMGIYVMEPDVLDYIPKGGYFDFPDLVHALLAAEERVGAYVYDGLWFDIGRQEDYERAINAWDGYEQLELPEVLSSNGAGASRQNGSVTRERKGR
jgi:NDP-mannose synthase